MAISTHSSHLPSSIQHPLLEEVFPTLLVKDPPRSTKITTAIAWAWQTFLTHSGRSFRIASAQFHLYKARTYHTLGWISNEEREALTSRYKRCWRREKKEEKGATTRSRETDLFLENLHLLAQSCQHIQIHPKTPSYIPLPEPLQESSDRFFSHMLLLQKKYGFTLEETIARFQVCFSQALKTESIRKDSELLLKRILIAQSHKEEKAFLTAPSISVIPLSEVVHRMVIYDPRWRFSKEWLERRLIHQRNQQVVAIPTKEGNVKVRQHNKTRWELHTLNAKLQSLYGSKMILEQKLTHVMTELNKGRTRSAHKTTSERVNLGFEIANLKKAIERIEENIAEFEKLYQKQFDLATKLNVHHLPLHYQPVQHQHNMEEICVSI